VTAFRKRVRIDDDTSVNVSGTGASVSKRIGRLTISSRGRGSVRILPGLSFRFGKRRR
jgi:hypothetical protein